MKRLLITASVVLLLAGCDDPPKTPAPVVAACTGASEVTDLIRRLKPVSRYPEDSKWEFESGVEITFSPNKVKIDIKLPNNNQLSSRAPSLREAVLQLHEAPANVKKALEGY